MRDAVEAAFEPLDLADSDDRKRRCRLRSDAVRRVVATPPEELAELESAASALERTGLASLSRTPELRSARRTRSRSVSVEQPNLAATETTAAHCDRCSS